MNRRSSKGFAAPSGRWPHRLAWVLAGAAFVQVWLGSLVTAYQAGMAAPDWPTTYGHWFYPLPRWLGAPWDLFLQYGHRLLAQAVGVLAVALAVGLWMKEPRKWMRLVGVAVVLGVCVQGIFGGLRVLGQSVLLAKVHGCTAPLLFGLCAAVVTLSCPRWQHRDGPQPHRAARRLQLAAGAVAVGLYLLIVLDAQLRRLTEDAWLGLLPVMRLKAIAAGVVLALLIWLLIDGLRHARGQLMLVGRVALVGGLFLVQLVLAVGTWVTHYGWPAWFADYVLELQYTPVPEGRLQVWITSGQTVVGSLGLATSLSLTLWSHRLLRASRG